jgi:hypothetical protein
MGGRGWLDADGSDILVGAEEGAGVAGMLLQELVHYLQVGEQFSLLANGSLAISIDLSIDKLISYTKVKKVQWP